MTKPLKPRRMKVIISGGGTGGHIYPAIAIAEALVARIPAVDILFVGASDRMEMGDNSSIWIQNQRALDCWISAKAYAQKFAFSS